MLLLHNCKLNTEKILQHWVTFLGKIVKLLFEQEVIEIWYYKLSSKAKMKIHEERWQSNVEKIPNIQLISARYPSLGVDREKKHILIWFDF